MNLFYYLSTCDTCKRIIKELQLPENVEMIDIKKNLLTEDQLNSLFSLSQSYGSLLNRRAQKLKEIDKSNLSEEKIKTLLLTHYTFLKRPVLLFKGELFIGNSKSTVEAAQKKLYG